MRTKLLSSGWYKSMPWKNGGGTTSEIAIEHAADGSMLWRLSIADVKQSGPFSDFSGCDRTIMLLEGRGFVLNFDQAPTKRLDRHYELFDFSGDWRTDCTLIDGPVRDFNLIRSRSAPPARVETLRLPDGATTLEASGTILLYAVTGEIEVPGDSFLSGDTMRIDDAPGRFTLMCDGPAILIAVRIGAAA